MIYWELFISFFKVGLFTIGGGYAMLPLIQQEIEAYQWITTQEFIDILAIAEMTPGPVAVNTATFVGYKSAGVLGSLLATTAVALPSLIIILLLARFLEKYQEHPIMKAVFSGIRPAVAGLIGAAAIFIIRNTLFVVNGGTSLGLPDLRAVLIAIAVFIAVHYYKVDPIKVIIASAVVGLIIF